MYWQTSYTGKRPHNSAELAADISNLLQKMIATENRQVLFIGQFVKWSTGAVIQGGGQP
jgi:hypothetical protein